MVHRAFSHTQLSLCLALVMGLKLEKTPPNLPCTCLSPLAHGLLSMAIMFNKGLIRGAEPLGAVCQPGWWQPQCIWTPSLRLRQKPGTCVLVSSSERDRLSQTTVAQLRSILLPRVDTTTLRLHGTPPYPTGTGHL